MIVGKIAGIAGMTVGKIAATAGMIVGMIVVTTKITKKDSATGWTADRKITGIVESATRTIPAITEKEIRLTAKAFAKATLRVIRDTTAGEGGNEEGKQCGQPFGMSALRQKPQAEKSAAFLRSTWPLIF